jgi:hypothetical protein
MRRAIAAVVLVLVVGVVLLYALKADPYPLQTTEAQSVRALVVSDHEGHRVEIVKADEIAFFLEQTRGLRSSSQQKVGIDFEIQVHLQDDSIVRLRMSRECIGPDVPASAGVTRWYFEKTDVYEFLKGKLSRAQRATV